MEFSLGVRSTHKISNNLHKTTKRFLSTCFPSASELAQSTYTPLPPVILRARVKVYLSCIIPHLCFLHLFTGMYILRSCLVYPLHERRWSGVRKAREMYLFNYLWMNCLEDDDISDTVQKVLAIFLHRNARRVWERAGTSTLSFIFCYSRPDFGLCIKFPQLKQSGEHMRWKYAERFRVRLW